MEKAHFTSDPPQLVGQRIRKERNKGKNLFPGISRAALFPPG